MSDSNHPTERYQAILGNPSRFTSNDAPRRFSLPQLIAAALCAALLTGVVVTHRSGALY
eukprot:IDg1811t1